MATWPTTTKGIQSRIASYRRVLHQENEATGSWSNGHGKRLWLFYLYFLLREEPEVRSYIDWYRVTFPDDGGDAGQFLCWALILHRLGHQDEAVYRFVQAIDEKLPVVAEVVDDLHAPYGIWGEKLWQMYRVDEAIIAAMTAEETGWLRSTWRSPAVAAMRERHIANGRAFAAATTREEREALSKAGTELVESFKPAEIPLLSTGECWLTSWRQTARRSSRKVIRTTPDVWRQ